MKNVDESGVTIAGVPAKVASYNNSHRFVFWFNNGEYLNDIGEM